MCVCVSVSAVVCLVLFDLFLCVSVNSMRFTDELEAIGLNCISVAQANLVLASPIICSIQALLVHSATSEA